MSLISRPQEFPGSPAEAQANRDSHAYAYTGGPEDADVRCWHCDCRPSYVSASWPCGAEVPRETVCTLCVQRVLHTHTPEEQAALASG